MCTRFGFGFLLFFFKVWVSDHRSYAGVEVVLLNRLFFFTPNAKVACFAYAFSVSCFVSLLAALWSSELLSCRGRGRWSTWETDRTAVRKACEEHGTVGRKGSIFSENWDSKPLKLLLQRTLLKRGGGKFNWKNGGETLYNKKSNKWKGFSLCTYTERLGRLYT